MHFGFEHIVSIIPSTSKSVIDLAKESGLDKAALEATLKNGLLDVPISVNLSSPELSSCASTQLINERPDLKTRLEALILCHSLPIPHGIDLIGPSLAAIGLDNIPALALTGQPCAIFHSAIQTAQTWLSTLSEEAGILIIGVDVAAQSEDRLFFNSAMGDAAIAGVLTKNSSHHRILSSVTDTWVRAWGGEKSPGASIANFRASNPTFIRKNAEQCLSKTIIGFDDLALIIPHTPNKLLWDTLAILMRFPRSRILTDYIHKTGHFNSNDSFINYLSAINDGKLKTGDYALLINPGFGGTCGCTLMQV